MNAQQLTNIYYNKLNIIANIQGAAIHYTLHLQKNWHTSILK